MRNESSERQRQWLPLVILLVLLLLGCGIFFGLKLAAWRTGTKVAFSGVNLVVDASAKAAEPDETPTSSSQGVAIPGWGSITIPAGQSEVAVDFYNPESNAELYYLTFELRLQDDSETGYEVLYTSGLVEAGLHIQSITLSRPLDAGEYDAVVHVQPYRMDEDCTATNNADMKTRLIVQ